MTAAPQTSRELQDSFHQIASEISRTVSSLPPNDFLRSPSPEAWNIRQLLDHLVRSIQPVAKVMGTPKRVLLRSFGKPQSGSRAFDAIQAVYDSELAGGAVAAGPFLPDPAAGDSEILQAWQTACADFQNSLSAWSDEDLDTHQVPHPLIGLLTIREMVMFSIHHCRHHFEEIEQIL